MSDEDRLNKASLKSLVKDYVVDELNKMRDEENEIDEFDDEITDDKERRQHGE